jgi:hypothetical protein
MTCERITYHCSSASGAVEPIELVAWKVTDGRGRPL